MNHAFLISKECATPVSVNRFNDPRGARHWGADLAPQPSHEGSWCQASIALPNRKLLPSPRWSPGEPSRSFANSYRLLADVGPVEFVGDALASSKRSGKSTGPFRGAARGWANTSRHKHECGKSNPYIPTCHSVLESVARAHLLTAALMATEPHIRSPFSERLAPQSLILEVIGLGRGESKLYCGISQPLFATVHPPGSNAADQASWNSR